MKPTFDEIYRATIEEFGMTDEGFWRSIKSRDALFVRVRQALCYIARSFDYSSLYIAKKLKYNHSTVLYHEKTAQDHIRFERDYKGHLDSILRKLRESSNLYKIDGFLVREGDGFTMFFEGDKPSRVDGAKLWVVEDGEAYSIPEDAFPQITWESEPQECEMTLRLKQHGE
jgi:hypothetical protein